MRERVYVKERGVIMAQNLWNLVTELKSDAYEWVGLSHRLNNESPVWSGIPKGSVELGKPCFDWDNDILECQIQTFKFPGQFGTHIDFPGHFVRGAALAEAFGPYDMVYPLVVINVADKVAKDQEYAMTVEDIKAFEAEHGQIPEGAFVALRTDWYKRWPNMDLLSGVDADGVEHAPGWSLEALRYIYEERNAAGNGHETLDTDASYIVREHGDLVCERYVLSKGKIQIELLANLDRVAPTGAVLFAAWANIEGANGLPVRAVAVQPKR